MMTGVHPVPPSNLSAPREYNRWLSPGEHSTFILVLCAPQKAEKNLGVHKFGFGIKCTDVEFKSRPKQILGKHTNFSQKRTHS